VTFCLRANGENRSVYKHMGTVSGNSTPISPITNTTTNLIDDQDVFLRWNSFGQWLLFRKLAVLVQLVEEARSFGRSLVMLHLFEQPIDIYHGQYCKQPTANHQSLLLDIAAQCHRKHTPIRVSNSVITCHGVFTSSRSTLHGDLLEQLAHSIRNTFTTNTLWHTRAWTWPIRG
jgi:hypothetical protein